MINELVGVLGQQIDVPGHLPGADRRLIALLLFASPAIAVLGSWKVPRLQYGILVVLILLVLIDLSVMFSFKRYNSANGGYDGMDQMVTLNLHVLVGCRQTKGGRASANSTIELAMVWPNRDGDAGVPSKANDSLKFSAFAIFGLDRIGHGINYEFVRKM